MAMRNAGTPLSEDRCPENRRREIFLALAELQDRDVPVGESRSIMAERVGLTVADIWIIEREGLDKNWPPL
jgi:hypothetical protein